MCRLVISIPAPSTCETDISASCWSILLSVDLVIGMLMVVFAKTR